VLPFVGDIRARADTLRSTLAGKIQF